MRLFENIHLRNLSSLQEQVVDEEAPTEEGLGLQMPKVQGLFENVDKVVLKLYIMWISLLSYRLVAMYDGDVSDERKKVNDTFLCEKVGF